MKTQTTFQEWLNGTKDILIKGQQATKESYDMLYGYRLEKYAKYIGEHARNEQVLGYQVAMMPQENLYWFLEGMLNALPCLQQFENKLFQEDILETLGNDNEVHAFMWIRDRVSQIVQEAEGHWPDLDFMQECREFAQMQAVAGWHHISPNISPNIQKRRDHMDKEQFIKKAEFIGPYDPEVGGYPVRDKSRRVIGVADNMPNSDEEFNELVAKAKIFID